LRTEKSAFKKMGDRLPKKDTVAICSALVHFRKPDCDIYRLTLDTAHVWPERVVYADNPCGAGETRIEIARLLLLMGSVSKAPATD
jgi:hypothetical protein